MNLIPYGILYAITYIVSYTILDMVAINKLDKNNAFFVGTIFGGLNGLICYAFFGGI